MSYVAALNLSRTRSLRLLYLGQGDSLYKGGGGGEHLVLHPDLHPPPRFSALPPPPPSPRFPPFFLVFPWSMMYREVYWIWVQPSPAALPQPHPSLCGGGGKRPQGQKATAIQHQAAIPGGAVAVQPQGGHGVIHRERALPSLNQVPEAGHGDPGHRHKGVTPRR